MMTLAGSAALASIGAVVWAHRAIVGAVRPSHMRINFCNMPVIRPRGAQTAAPRCHVRSIYETMHDYNV